MGFYEEAQEKIEEINSRMNCIDNTYKESKKINRRLMILGTVSLVAISITSGLDDKISSLDVVALSCLIVTLHSCLKSSIDAKLDHQHNIKKLEIDKKYYESIINGSKSSVELI